MHTNVEIDEQLLKAAQQSSGLQTKQETVEEALKLLVMTRMQAPIRSLRGKLQWEGSLEEMRVDQ